MPGPLSAQDGAVVAEEADLLDRTRAALRAAADRARRSLQSRGRAEESAAALREQAIDASEADLPALLQGLGAAQALARRAGAPPPPDPASPYFAHLRLRMQGEARDYLLGRGTFVDLQAGLRVVDWRISPVAQVFYRYQEGDDFEEPFPAGPATGLVEARRILVIEGGQLTRVLTGSRSLVRLPDGSWAAEEQAALAGGAGTAAREGFLGVGAGAPGRRGRPDVTAMLDAEQHAALSAPEGRPLLVLGSAGSGKTTVALHRLARIAVAHGGHDAMAVVVPEEGLARLSRRLLAPLGLAEARVETLATWLARGAAAAFGARGLRLHADTPPLASALKRHPALREPLLRRVGDARGLSFPALRARIADVLTDRGLLEEVVARAAGSLPRTAVEETVRHARLQLETPLARQLRGYDPERLQTLDDRPIEEGTPDEIAGTLDVEDLALLLFLRARSGARLPERLTHLVLDEAEDFSVYELHALGRQLAPEAGATLAGDELQQTAASFPGWSGALEALGVRDPAVCRLEVSYRCPQPVTELARAVLGAGAAAGRSRAARAGAPVGLHHFPEAAQAHLFLAGALRDLVDREPGASVGVVAAGASAARAFHASLDAVPGARLVLDGAFTFEPGVDVTDVESAKGLEWDYVVVPDATAAAYPADDEARRRLHVAVTRASHQLWVLSWGRRTPLLAGAAPVVQGLAGPAGAA